MTDQSPEPLPQEPVLKSIPSNLLALDAYVASAEIDNAVTSTLVRVIWRVLSQHSPDLRQALAEALNDDVQGLRLQQELNQDEDDHQTSAIIQILSTLKQETQA